MIDKYVDTKRISLFDSLKGFAILCIITIHLGQWHLDFPMNSKISVALSSGLLGVELTYLINAFFYSKKYYETKFSINDILKMFLQIIPVYYFGLITYGITTYYCKEELTDSTINILSHFFFLNGVYYKWWNGYMGGTGYFGILALIWILYPIYLKKINNTQQSLVYASIAIGGGYAVSKLFILINNNLALYNTNIFADYINYLYRGIYCFSAGNVLYYLYCSKNTILFFNKLSKYCVLIMIITRMIIQGSKFDGLLFTILFCCVILQNIKNSLWIIDNRVFSFLGKNITELFVTHIILHYVLVENLSLLSTGNRIFFVLFMSSIIISPILKILITKPCTKWLIRKLLKYKTYNT